jgi:hypothetical protein
VGNRFFSDYEVVRSRYARSMFGGCGRGCLAEAVAEVAAEVNAPVMKPPGGCGHPDRSFEDFRERASRGGCRRRAVTEPQNHLGFSYQSHELTELAAGTGEINHLSQH